MSLVKTMHYYPTVEVVSVGPGRTTLVPFMWGVELFPTLSLMISLCHSVSTQLTSPSYLLSDSISKLSSLPFSSFIKWLALYSILCLTDSFLVSPLFSCLHVCKSYLRKQNLDSCPIHDCNSHLHVQNYCI